MVDNEVMEESVQVIELEGKPMNCFRGRPEEPFKHVRIVDDKTMWIVDRTGELWTYEPPLVTVGQRMFVNNCLRSSLAYVYWNDPKMKNVKPSMLFELVGIDDPRGSSYDELYADWLNFQKKYQ